MGATYTEVTLDKPRRLRFTINSIADLEDHLNRPIADIARALFGLSVRDLRGVYWAGLKGEDRRLTPESVGEILEAYLDGGGELSTLYGAANEALITNGLFRATAARADAGGNAPGAPAAP